MQQKKIKTVSISSQVPPAIWGLRLYAVCWDRIEKYGGCSCRMKVLLLKIHAEGIRLVLWQIPVYKKMEDGRISLQNQLDSESAVRGRLCVMNSDGTPYAIPDGHWFEGSLIPDFTNPAARKSWFDRREYLLDIGVDGFKTDGGEFIYSDDVILHDGRRPERGYAGNGRENIYLWLQLL